MKQNKPKKVKKMIIKQILGNLYFYFEKQRPPPLSFYPKCRVGIAHKRWNLLNEKNVLLLSYDLI
jgi:hypothetical protein